MKGPLFVQESRGTKSTVFIKLCTVHGQQNQTYFNFFPVSGDEFPEQPGGGHRGDRGAGDHARHLSSQQ